MGCGHALSGVRGHGGSGPSELILSLFWRDIAIRRRTGVLAGGGRSGGERNIIATQRKERERLDPGYGEYEANEREAEVIATQKRIRHVLTERYYAWSEARELAETDPEVDLSGRGPAYSPINQEVGD